MPKSKDLVSSSESGSDSEQEKPKAKKQKKERKEEKANDGAKGFKDDNGDMTFELNAMKRVTVRSFKGRKLIDIREYYNDGDKMKPGKKGISLQPDQWKVLKSVMSEIDEAVENL